MAAVAQSVHSKDGLVCAKPLVVLAYVVPAHADSTGITQIFALGAKLELKNATARMH